MAIDYGLDVRQAAIDRFTQAEAGKARALAEKKASDEKAARQKRKGLMTLAIHGGAAVATGGASIPYSMKYGGMANKTLMGEDYQGSDMQSLQGLGSMVYQGAEANKTKNLAGMEKAYNGQLDDIYKTIDSLPPSAGKMERAFLANQAANLTTTFQKNLKAAEAKPVWEFASSERERQQAKSLGEVADRGQEAYDEAYTRQLMPQKVKEAQGSTDSNRAIDDAYARTGSQVRGTTPLAKPNSTQYDDMLSPRQEAARRRSFRPSELGAYNNPYSMDSSISTPEQKRIDYRDYKGGFLGGRF